MTLRVHVVNFIVLPLLYLLAILVSRDVEQLVWILILAVLNLSIVLLVNNNSIVNNHKSVHNDFDTMSLQNIKGSQVNYKAMGYFILVMLPVVGATFLSGYLFASEKYLLTAPVILFGLLTVTTKTYIALKLSVRIFVLAVVGFSYAIHTNYEELLNYSLQKKIVSVNIGYALLAVNNAFGYLKKEFERILIATKMRYQKRYLSPKIMLPLLVSAARYSHNLSISIHGRGLNKNKTYVIPYQRTTYLDYGIILFNLISIFSILFFC